MPRRHGPHLSTKPRPHARPQPSDQPSCRHFGRCGSCSLLTTPIEQQLGEKIADVETLLLPFLRGRPVQTATPRATPIGFRTRLLFPACSDPQGLPILGMFQAKSRELVRIKECRTLDERLTALGVAAEGIVRGLQLAAFDAATGSGTLIAFMARLAAGTGELMLGVVTRPGLFEVGPELAERLQAAAASLDLPGQRPLTPVGVVRSITERADGFLLGERHVPLKGRDYIEDRQDGLRFRVGFGSFYQVHKDASALLYRPAMRMLGDLRGQRVVDGYGGVGTFGLRCAAAGAASVEVVEDNASACRDAEHNARVNQFPQVRVQRSSFHAADFAPAPDLLIVDPPRSGLSAAGVDRVLAANPARILHVACSAEALANDLEGLCHRGGYDLREARLCDMFPHTEHVEVLALLTRRS